MHPTFYSILHVASAFMLVAMTFQGFADTDAKRRRQVVIASGIFSFLMLVGGFGLLAKYKYGWPLWMFVKLACWFGISAMAGIAYRAQGKTKVLSLLTVALLVTALCMVYLKPM